MTFSPNAVVPLRIAPFAAEEEKEGGEGVEEEEKEKEEEEEETAICEKTRNKLLQEVLSQGRRRRHRRCEARKRVKICEPQLFSLGQSPVPTVDSWTGLPCGLRWPS